MNQTPTDESNPYKGTMRLLRRYAPRNDMLKIFCILRNDN